MPVLEANACIQAAMLSISFNVNGILNLLSNLDPNKAHGPDGISNNHWTQENYHLIGWLQISALSLKKVTVVLLQITDQYP